MRIYNRFAIALLSSAALLAFLLATNPKNLPLGLLLIPFMLFGVAAYQAIRFFMAIFRYSSDKPTKQRIVALVFTVLLTNFAVLQSVGSITVQDVVLAVAITAVVALYIAKFQTAR